MPDDIREPTITIIIDGRALTVGPSGQVAAAQLAYAAFNEAKGGYTGPRIVLVLDENEVQMEIGVPITRLRAHRNQPLLAFEPGADPQSMLPLPEVP